MKTLTKGFTLIIAFFMMSVEAFSQLNAIKGNVKDESEEPLAGASVVVLNSTRGVITDKDGNFELQASEKETLQISFLGFEPYNVVVGKRSYIEVTLQQKADILEDLVVVGYGVQKKANLTGSVATVNYADEVKSRPVTSTAQVLQGLNAGIRITQPSGQPGAESILIRIRGEGTLNSSAPLIIVDGFEGTISNVNPDDIENVSILKDAASSAIYGNRGANGVVLITTKSGGRTPGKANISYSSILAKNVPASRFKVISNYADYMTIMNESAENVDAAVLPFSQAMIDLWREKEKDPSGISESGYPNYVAYPNTDWMDAVYNDAVYQKHNLSVNGSSKTTNYLVSLSYIDNPGVISNTGMRKFQLRTNLSVQVTKALEIGTKLWGYESSADVSDTYFGLFSRAVPGIYPFYDGKYGWMENPEQSSDSRNNLYFFDRMGGSDKRHYTNSTVFANVKLPVDIKYNVSFNYSRTDTEYRSARKVMNAYSFRRGEVAYFYDNLDNLTMTHRNGFAYRWTFQNSLFWNKVFADKNDVSALVGFETTYSNSNSNQLVKQRFENDQLTELNNAIDMNEISGNQTDFAGASVFSRLTYAYDSRYLFEANVRYDGSSRFASQSRWGIFPSASAGWRISEEAFMQGLNIDNLKLRISWGKLGNNSIGNYDYQSTYASGYQYSFGNKLASGIVSTLSNNALRWETTTSTNIGLDLGVLRNRLTVEADIYNKKTDGILYRAPIYATIGNKSAPYQNLCEVTNKGFELTVGWEDRSKDFYYSINANFTRNWNQVSKYKGRLQAGWEADEYGHRSYKSNIGDVTTVIDGARRTMEGKIINEHYLLNPYSGNASYFFADGSVNPAGGPKDGMIRTPEDMAWLEAMIAGGSTFLPNRTVGKTGIWYGDYIYADINGDGVYGDANDYTFQNVSKTPKYYYGLSIELGWKGFDCSMLLEGAGGSASYWRYVGFNAYSTGRNFTLPKEIAYDHYFYDPANPEDSRTNITSKHGRLTMNYGSEQNGGSNYSTVFLYKTDYLRLKSITIGYTFPKKWMKIEKNQPLDLRIFLSGENLMTFTDYPGMDPELSDTMNYYALLKQYSLGLSVKF
jgi:TonB-linked SusC/RagA family outer membrane protein